MQQTFKLEPRFDNRKSFYNKAFVHETVSPEEDYITLQSYNTIVARYDRLNNDLEVYGTYSDTTLRHLKEFINTWTRKQANTKKEVEAFIK